MGRSRGGLTTKIHAAVDAVGNPVALSLTPGQASDISQAEPLLKEIDPKAFLADKADDADALISALDARGIAPVIPRAPSALPLAKPISPSIVSAIWSSGSSANSSSSAPSPPVMTNSRIHSLRRWPWFAYCSGSTDDTP